MRIEYKYSDEVQKMIDDAEEIKEAITNQLKKQFDARVKIYGEASQRGLGYYYQCSNDLKMIREHIEKIYSLSIPEVIIVSEVSENTANTPEVIIVSEVSENTANTMKLMHEQYDKLD